jgi:hypothetical protein
VIATPVRLLTIRSARGSIRLQGQIAAENETANTPPVQAFAGVQKEAAWFFLSATMTLFSRRSDLSKPA